MKTLKSLMRNIGAPPRTPRGELVPRDPFYIKHKHKTRAAAQKYYNQLRQVITRMQTTLFGEARDAASRSRISCTANHPEIMKIEIIAQRNQVVISALLEIWEASVAATHDFLTAKDIQTLKPWVFEAVQTIETLVTAGKDDGIITAFIGTARDKIEMLFVAPQARGTGIGRQLISYAVNELHIRYVDVNEQNPQAVGFYEKMGFKVFGRSELDTQGNPYPLLHMRLDSLDN